MKAIIFNLLLALFAVFFTSSIQAQFAIGHTTITFNDPNRAGGFGSGGGPGRQIQTEIYYPTASAGDNVPVSSGEFPVVVIGHGFVMSWDAYANIWGLLVPQGYIVALPRTEGSFSPNHPDFALDLVQVLDKIFELDNVNTSIFYQKVGTTGALLGHSMGGGSAFLGGAITSSATTIVGLAPAETTGQSAIAAAANIAVPVLVFSGSEDAVTPPAEHHLPIYNAAASECKFYLSIVGGGHCYFANANTNCDFGELLSGLPSMNRATQQGLMNQFLLPWLDWHLKDNQEAALEFQTLLPATAQIDAQTDCVVLSGENKEIKVLKLYPNPTSGQLFFEFQEGEIFTDVQIQIYSVDGKLQKNIQLRELNSGYVLPVNDLTTGVYHLNLTSGKGSYTTRFVKQ
jgi:dienelactone hydrolase